MKILFICSANTCRSPMAEVIAKNLIAGADVKSAGIWAVSGSPASAHARSCMRAGGFSLENHASRHITRELIDWADVALCMTKEHKRGLIGRYPDSADKTFTLCEYAGEEGEIFDPFGADLKSYEFCAGELRRIISAAAEKLAK